jgi:hypothetical protein
MENIDNNLEKEEESSLNLEIVYGLIKNNNKQSNIPAINLQNLILTKQQIKNFVKYIPFNDKTNWYYSSFSTSYNKRSIEYPLIVSNVWTEANLNNENGIEITNKIFESQESVNYNYVDSSIKANILLQGESSFWIFLHTNKIIDENTGIIIVTKKEYSQNVVISLGTFANFNKMKIDGDNGNSFHIYNKQQLIENLKLNKKKNDKYENSDACSIKLEIFDEGNDKIEIKAKLNDGKEDNLLTGYCFNQVANVDCNSGEYKFMLAGSGKYCKVNNFYCETNLKKSLLNNKKGEVEFCRCCNIF